MIQVKRKPPSLRFLFAHPAHLVACGFGSGLAPFAPGTFGTLFAWASFPLLRPWFGEIEFFGLLVVCFIGGVIAAHKTGQDLGVTDHGAIVWDEVVPFWLVLFFCPEGFLWQTVAFFAFRFFDIFKPQPARYFDQMKNGFGVMTDDLIAGGYTVLTLALVRFFVR